MKWLIHALLALSICFPALSQPEGFRVVFINPGHPDKDATGRFWSNVNRFMQAAATDFGIDLISLYAQRNHLLMTSLVTQIDNLKPDYVILVNEKGVAVRMLQQLGNSPFPVFMLLNTLDNAEYDALPKPQQQRLIGSVQPNNHSVGKRLTEDLIALFQQKASRAPLTLYALQGDYTTPASLARQQGMLSALANVPSIRVIDSTVANWSRHQAYTKALGLFQRQAIDVVWAANDPMAFGAKQALQELSQQGTTLIGGINWDAQDSQFPLDVSYGGHVTLGALAMVMLHDFHHALAEKDHMHQVVDIFERGTPTHIAAFNQLLTDNHLENVDFRQFSKASPAPRPFTIDNILGTGKQQ